MTDISPVSHLKHALATNKPLPLPFIFLYAQEGQFYCKWIMDLPAIWLTGHTRSAHPEDMPQQACPGAWDF